MKPYFPTPVGKSQILIAHQNTILWVYKVWANFCNILELIFLRRSSNRTPPQKKNRSDDSEISMTEDSEQVKKVKKGLKDLNPTDSDFPEGTRMLGYFGTNIKNYGSISKTE